MRLLPSRKARFFGTHRSRLVDEASLAYSYWRQRTRDQHCQLEKLPSSFLFNCIKQRQKCNHLYMLRDSQGNWLEEPQDIANLISAHFRDLYSANTQTYRAIWRIYISCMLRELHLPTLSHSHLNSLLTAFSYQKIRDAMFDIANDKSPGLDGFPTEFFKLYWPTVGS